jgi:hypothetical protein
VACECVRGDGVALAGVCVMGQTAEAETDLDGGTHHLMARSLASSASRSAHVDLLLFFFFQLFISCVCVCVCFVCVCVCFC